MSGFENIFDFYPGSIGVSGRMGSNPARVHRISGDITLNEDTVYSASDEELKYVLSHEAGHFLLNTRCEFMADEFAFNQLAGQFPKSLKGSILALSRHLPFETREQKERLIIQLLRALRYDFQINGNSEALKTYNELKNRIMSKPSYQSSYFKTDDPFDNLSGKERRQAKKDLKLEKKKLENDRYAVKTDKKAAKGGRIAAQGEAKIVKANAKQIKAEKGEGEGGNWFDKTLATVGGILGGGSGSETPTQKEVENQPKFLGMPKMVGIIVTIVVGLSIIGVAAYFIFRK